MEKTLLQWALWTLFGALLLTSMPDKARVPFLVVIILGALVYMEKKKPGESARFFKKLFDWKTE